MKRALVLLVLLMTSVLGAAPAGSVPIQPRTIEFPYTGIGVIEVEQSAAIVFLSCASINDANYGGACFKPGPGEDKMSITVTDQSGQDVGFYVNQGSYQDQFCSATDQPISLSSRKRIQITLAMSGCALPSVPTDGVITVTLR